MRWQVGKVSDDKYQADMDLVAVVLEYSQGIAEVKNFTIWSTVLPRSCQAIEGKVS